MVGAACLVPCLIKLHSMTALGWVEVHYRKCLISTLGNGKKSGQPADALFPEKGPSIATL